MANLNTIFANTKLTENGDVSYKSTLNPLLDILFMSEYYQKHLNEVEIGDSQIEQIFAMFIRDPRYGLGRRDLGRTLMEKTNLSIPNIIKAGRYDDLSYDLVSLPQDKFEEIATYLFEKCLSGDELCKKWMPRYSSKRLMSARRLAKFYNMNKQQYGKFIKVNTVESNLSRRTTDDIIFEHVPSQAMLKYYSRFLTGEDTAARFKKYINAVKDGKAKLNISTSTVYDIYKNADKIDPQMFFDKIEKISGNWIPIVDTSGSMCDTNDSFGKALAIGHYLAKCSTYAPDTVISFSSRPKLIHLGDGCNRPRYNIYNIPGGDTQWHKEIQSMFTGDCTNTDFGAVMNLLKDLDPDNSPEYLVVLSDMEFDCGSRTSKDTTMAMFKERGINTKIIWWNFNCRNTTCPETDSYGNIFLSGYSPMLLKYLETGFDGNAFLMNMLKEYHKIVFNK